MSAKAAEAEHEYIVVQHHSSARVVAGSAWGAFFLLRFLTSSKSILCPNSETYLGPQPLSPSSSQRHSNLPQASSERTQQRLLSAVCLSLFSLSRGALALCCVRARACVRVWVRTVLAAGAGIVATLFRGCRLCGFVDHRDAVDVRLHVSRDSLAGALLCPSRTHQAG